MAASARIKIFYDGNVYIKFDPITRVQSIVSDYDRIAFSGTSEEAMRIYAKKADSMVNLKGQTVFPGFVDSHIHLDDLGNSLNFLDVRNAHSIKEMKKRVADYRKRNPEARIIVGMGWDQEEFSEGRWPNRWDIDEVENSVPVFLERFCEHAGVINSNMLALMGAEKFPEKIFPRTESGEISGIVKEEAASFFKSIALQLAGNLEKNLISGARYLASLGVTTIGFVSCGTDSLEVLSRKREEIKIRTRAYLKMEIGDEIESLRRKFGDDHHLVINGIKLFVDGALGARTAALSKPYDDDQQNKGILYLDSEKLRSIFQNSKGKEVQFAIHAIGDEGIDAVVDAVSSLDRKTIMEPRIEHCTVLRANQVARLKSLGIGISVQPAFVLDDWWAVKRLGRERSKIAYPLGTLVREGIKVGISTDSPVASPNPWFTLDAAVNRGEREKLEILECSPQERIELACALHLYMEGSASLLMDKSVGSLESGKFADFIILNADPFNVQDLREIRVRETYVGGECVFTGR
jgi:predicted amidohydrolase YtcJ